MTDWLALLPPAIWLAGMLVGLGYTLRAMQIAAGDMERERGVPLLELVARRNLRAERLRVGTLACFVLAGLLSLSLQVWPPGDTDFSWQRWAIIGLLLVGGLGVVANSVLDAWYRTHLRAAILRADGGRT